MNRNLQILALLFAFALSTLTKGEGWTQKANFTGTGRFAMASFSIGGKGYFCAGVTQASVSLNDLWEYDPIANAWTQKANLTGATRSYLTSFSLGGYGYVGMGRDAFNASVLQDFWRYDPGSNAWAAMANFGGGTRSGATGFTIGAKGYVTCGYSGSTLPLGNRNDLWEYDPGTDTWAQLSNFPGVPRQFPLGFSVGTTGYVGAGNNGGSLYDLWVYHQLTDTWTTAGNVPFYYGDQGHSIGLVAYVTSGAATWQYTPGTDTWTARTNYPGAGSASGPTTFSIGTKLYAGSGLTQLSQIALDLWEYDPTDCLGNIGGNALPGTACNDGNPNTINDTWNGSCVCVGCTPPSIPTTSTSGPVCAGGSPYLYSSSTGTPPLNYVWTGPGTIVNPTQSNTQVIAPLAGYSYLVTVTNACGSNSAFVGPVVNNPPTLSPVITPESCPGANDGAINLSLIGGGGPVTVTWSSATTCAFNGQCPANFPT